MKPEKRWHIRLDLTNPIPDHQLENVRQQLIDTLNQAGYPAKTTTAEWWLADRKPEPPMGKPPGQTTEPALLRRRHGKDTWQ